MPRGPKKHLKRLNAPKAWMLDKLGGVFSVKPSSGPHKTSESLPIGIFLRNRLKYALNMKEVQTIVKQRLIKIDGKVRTDHRFPTGFMDVIQVEKTGENFRIIYDVKGRFTVHRITAQEAKYKLCKVREVKTGPKGTPYLYTNDGRTIRYPDPVINESDTVMVDIATNKITDRIKYDAGSLVMITGGRNRGRVGVIQRREKHKGAIEIVHVKDAGGHEFATRSSNTFVIGEGNKPMISLPKGKGLRLTIVEELERRKEA